MKKLIAFDLDDTLATTKRPITPRMASLLEQLAEHYAVCVITGGTYKQVKAAVIDQLPSERTHLANFYFMPVNGVQFYHFNSATGEWDHEQYVEDLPESEQQKIAHTLEAAAKELGYWEDNPTGDIIEFRGTQVTYSALGQQASPEDKYGWDPSFEKRRLLQAAVSKALPEYKVQINGNTSVDVTRPGFDKGFGLTKIMETLNLQTQDVVFFGDQFQETGNDYPVLALGVDTVNVANWEETAVGIEELIAQAGAQAKDADRLDQIIEQLKGLHPASREDMKQQAGELLKDCEPELIDTHNTLSMIYKFTADGVRYGVKMEFGEAEVVRDEAQWYERAPANLRTHHVASYSGEQHVFVLLRWLNNARTIDAIAIANEGKQTTETTDLILKALNQDKELFNTNPQQPLTTSKEHSYFLDKYHSYNAKAKDFPYLQALLDSKTVRVNSQDLPGPYVFVQAVQQNDALREYLSPDTAGLIHGDSHLGNLLVEGDRVYMVDPKGVQPLPLEYDTGRVMWSLTGWNAIVNGEFSCSKDDDGYHLEYKERQQYVDGFARIRAYFTDQGYHRAVYSSVMQYLTRTAHATAEWETTALYLRGLLQFQELFDELGEKVGDGGTDTD